MPLYSMSNKHLIFYCFAFHPGFSHYQAALIGNVNFEKVCVKGKDNLDNHEVYASMLIRHDKFIYKYVYLYKDISGFAVASLSFMMKICFYICIFIVLGCQCYVSQFSLVFKETRGCVEPTVSFSSSQQSPVSVVIFAAFAQLSNFFVWWVEESLHGGWRIHFHEG